MWQKAKLIWKTKDLKNKILFTLFILVVFRFASHIPIAGVDVIGLQRFFSQNEFLGLVNVFSGGAMENFSVVMLGVAPYITASIIFQLLVMVIPSLEELSKEPLGHQKINQYTRYLTVPLAILQSFATIKLLQRSTQGIVGDLSTQEWILDIMIITGGTIFLMWLGEIISEKHVGNGVSLIIFAGIVSSLPSLVQQTLATYDSTQLPLLFILLGVAILTIIGVVYITEAQRNIPVSYARQMLSQKGYGSVSTHLPLRVNQAGVIPIIFAISLVVFPPLLAQLLTGVGPAWLGSVMQFITDMFNNQLVYGIIFFVLVVAFSYFYTAVVFRPDQVAENLQKRGGFIPGIRPGKATAEYLSAVSTRVLLVGSLFLGAIAVLPLVLKAAAGGSFQNLAIGGTSILIVVSVVIETVKKIEAQLTLRDYEQF